MSIKRYTKPARVFIRWMDHHSFKDQDWHHLEEFVTQPPIEVQSLGFLVAETKDQYMIVHNCHNESFSGCMSILKKVVREIKYLE